MVASTLMRRLAHVLVAFGVLPCVANGHVLDEYLQATLVAIEPGDIRLQLNLTPGAEIADKVLVLIDGDRDGEISNDEAAAYADMLRQDLVARLDGRRVELKLTTSNVPGLADLRTGHGIMQFEFSLKAGPLSVGSHKLAIENRHLPALGAYLFNAAKPASGSIQITEQVRNENQSTGEIELDFSPPPSSSNSLGAFGWVAALVLLLAAAATLVGLRRNKQVPSAS